MADRALHAIDAAKAGVLELGDLAAASDGRFAARFQGPVDHAFDDDRAGRVIGARFGAQPEELDARRVDVVLLDQPHDRGRGHRVNALVGPAHAETAPDDLANLGPLVVGPVTPVLEPDSIGRNIRSKAADADILDFAGRVHE